MLALLLYLGGPPILSWPGGTPVLSWGYPILTWLGVLCPGSGVSQDGITPSQDWGTAPERTWKRTWDWGTPRKDLGPVTWQRTWDWGTPPPQKVLCEHKRHNACYIASACSAVLCWGGIPSWPGWGIPHPFLARGYPSPVLEAYPVLAGGTPGWGTPTRTGVPPGQDWDIPQKGPETSDLGLGYHQKEPGTSGLGQNLGLGYPLERTWDQWPGKEPGTGVPPPGSGEQSKSLHYLPHPSDAGGKKGHQVNVGYWSLWRPVHECFSAKRSPHLNVGYWWWSGPMNVFHVKMSPHHSANYWWWWEPHWSVVTFLHRRQSGMGPQHAGVDIPPSLQHCSLCIVIFLN